MSKPRHLPISDAAKASGDLLPKGQDEPTPGGKTAEEAKLLQVGELAKACGKTVRAIHHYETVGLLTPHDDTKA